MNFSEIIQVFRRFLGIFEYFRDFSKYFRGPLDPKNGRISDTALQLTAFNIGILTTSLRVSFPVSLTGIDNPFVTQCNPGLGITRAPKGEKYLKLYIKIITGIRIIIAVS